LTGVAGHRCISGLLWARAWWSARGLVVAAGVEGEFAQEFSGVGVDASEVEIGDECKDAFAAVFAPRPMWRSWLS
jgi:hypothetical protein